MLDEHLDMPVAEDFYESAVTEYRFWMDQSEENSRRFITMTDSDGNEHNLNRYWDDNPAPREESWIEDVSTFEESGSDDENAFYRHIRAACESGWDFSSRWLADGKTLATIDTTNILPVDLNTLLWFAEKQLAEWSKRFSKQKVADTFHERAERRKSSINTLMWSDDHGFYFDFHAKKKKRTPAYSLAAVYPLYFKLANQKQAEAVSGKLESDFLMDGGLLTTIADTGQQWDSPNGWAPLQWLAVVGLRNYGFNSLAKEISSRWLALNEKVYRNTGKMVEKYNVADINKEGGGGEYPLQDGFGWTNGVFSALSDLEKSTG
jgi:alpha,alpha-trehalase